MLNGSRGKALFNIYFSKIFEGLLFFELPIYSYVNLGKDIENAVINPPNKPPNIRVKYL